MKNVFYLVLLAALDSFGQANESTTNLCRSKIQALAPMLGEWQGSGWSSGPGGKSTMLQTESVQLAQDETILLIRGRGTDKTAGREVFNSLGVVSYLPDEDRYHLNSWLADGRQTDAYFKVTEAGKMEWGFEIPDGEIKYEIFIEQDQMTEKGAYSPRGQDVWYPFLEMTLSRVNP